MTQRVGVIFGVILVACIDLLIVAGTMRLILGLIGGC